MTTILLNNLQVGKSIQYRLPVIGGDPTNVMYSITSGSLPPGLTLTNTKNGIGPMISGAPFTTGSGSCVLTITVGINKTTQPINWVVADVVPIVTLTIAPISLSSLQVGTLIRYKLSTTGGISDAYYSYTITSGSLPSGLQLISGGNGIEPMISGTPTTISSGFFVLSVTWSNITTTELVSWSVIAAPALNLTIAPTNMNGLVVGTTSSITFTVTSGQIPNTTYAYHVQTGNLPGGFVLNGDVLTGTPTITSSGSFDLVVGAISTTTGLSTGNQTFTIPWSVIAAPTLNLTIAPTTFVGAFQVGKVVTRAIIVNNYPTGSPNYGFGIQSGSLPDGLQMNGWGEITGTPYTTGSGFFGLVVYAKNPTTGVTIGTETVVIPWSVLPR